MAWCSGATDNYLSQYWSRFMSPNGVTRPQWLKAEVILRYLPFFAWASFSTISQQMSQSSPVWGRVVFLERKYHVSLVLLPVCMQYCVIIYMAKWRLESNRSRYLNGGLELCPLQWGWQFMTGNERRKDKPQIKHLRRHHCQPTSAVSGCSPDVDSNSQFYHYHTWKN